MNNHLCTILANDHNEWADTSPVDDTEYAEIGVIHYYN